MGIVSIGHNREERGERKKGVREREKGREGKGEGEMVFGGVAETVGLYSIEIGALTPMSFFLF